MGWTKPNSIGVYGTGLVWLLWFIDPQGDFKSNAVEFGWKDKTAHSFSEKYIVSFFIKAEFPRFSVVSIKLKSKPVHGLQFVLFHTKQLDLKKSIY